MFERLSKRAELSRIRFHDLRHSAITALLDAGVPLHIVSRWAGHASVSFTMDRYGHVCRDSEEETARRAAEARSLQRV